MPPDITIELIVLWLASSGVVWLACVAARFRAHGFDGASVALLAATGVGWIGFLRLATNALGPEIVPFDGSGVIRGEVPAIELVVLVVLLGLGATLAIALARRSTPALAVALFSMVVLPALAPPQMLRTRLPAATAAEPSTTPITAPEHPGMVLVPAGPFVMGTLSRRQLGSIVGNADGDEQPVRGVYLDAFYIDRTEVTNRDFGRFVDATGHVTGAEIRGHGSVWAVPGQAEGQNRDGWFDQRGAEWRHPVGPPDGIGDLDDHPVVQVDWNDAVAYCEWADKRLPTEAEWEKSARGIDARIYPWGWDFDASRLNYCDDACTLAHRDELGSDGYARTAPVGSFPGGASPYGALDMAGNVWEWVADWYDPDYYRYAPDVNPRGPVRGRRGAAGGSKVVRGASFAAAAEFQTTTSRSFDPLDESYFGVGFRCAVDG